MEKTIEVEKLARGWILRRNDTPPKFFSNQKKLEEELVRTFDSLKLFIPTLIKDRSMQDQTGRSSGTLNLRLANLINK